VRVACLAIGSRVVHDGGVWTVVALEGSRATIKADPSRQIRSVAIPHLLSAPGSRLLEATPVLPEPAVGPLFANLAEPELRELSIRAAHVREVLTGYGSGHADGALPGEPRPQYRPELPKMDRYRAKAAELNIGLATMRRWVAAYESCGEVGLIDARHQRASEPLRGIDPRWLDELARVLEEYVCASRPPRELLLDRVDARVIERHGMEAGAVPKRWKARRALTEISRGTNALVGSTKGKRSIANRSPAPYGRLVAVRPGEYLLLDTTALDVFAMDPITLRWVGVELTIAIDLCSRALVALRLSPVSTKAVDASLVLFEAICPDSTARTGGGLLPYPGVPSVVVIAPPDSAAEGLPGVAPETVVVDHGKIYVSVHLRSVCQRLGVSIQPARPFQPTDKAVVERFFRTVREDLLAALPGYKGPDVYSRGEHPEDLAYYFVDELEQIIREWAAERYHRSPHEGLVHPDVPGLELCPLDAFELGVARAGRLLVPARADLLYDFLPVEWRTIQHYGVEVHGLRYDGPGLNGYRNRRSATIGPNAGKWPLRYDPDDVRRVFFQDPHTHEWHELCWEHYSEIEVPFSAEALRYARRLARETERFPDDRRALHEMLERWDAGLTAGPAERRMALRLSQQRNDRLIADEGTPASVTDLASVRAVIGRATGEDELSEELLGDDDDELELSVVPADETDEHFYDEAFGTFS
jgi:transposase InsO family protein